ncbi:hypothetical protein [Natrarchaeobius chitinivorans]|nr:hypothetical protein [Natrarchaeobius chitinivorans]
MQSVRLAFATRSIRRSLAERSDWRGASVGPRVPTPEAQGVTV